MYTTPNEKASDVTLIILAVKAKNFHGSSDICLMDFIYSI